MKNMFMSGCEFLLGSSDRTGAVIQIQKYACTHHVIDHTYSCLMVASKIYLKSHCNSYLYRKEGHFLCYVRL